MKSVSMNNSKTLKTILTIAISLFAVFFTHKVLATPVETVNIDVYGTQRLTRENIIKRYGKEFRELTTYLQSMNLVGNAKVDAKVDTLFSSLTRQLDDKNNFAYFRIVNSYHLPENKWYYTIDVVEKKQSERLTNFSAQPQKSLSDPDGLLASWQEYSKLGWTEFGKTKKTVRHFKCPVTSCLFGFEEPEFKKYKDVFMKGVVKDKKEIINVLHNDKDAENRVAAAYLIGNLTNSADVIKILKPALHDSTDRVRSTAMSILANAFAQNSNANFPVKDVVAALDYPAASERSYAMNLLVSLADQPRYLKYVKKHASKQVFAALQVQEVGMHEAAYNMMKKMSGKTYGERDYTAWQNWLDAKSV